MKRYWENRITGKVYFTYAFLVDETEALGNRDEYILREYEI